MLTNYILWPAFAFALYMSLTPNNLTKGWTPGSEHMQRQTHQSAKMASPLSLVVALFMRFMLPQPCSVIASEAEDTFFSALRNLQAAPAGLAWGLVDEIDETDNETVFRYRPRSYYEDQAVSCLLCGSVLPNESSLSSHIALECDSSNDIDELVEELKESTQSLSYDTLTDNERMEYIQKMRTLLHVPDDVGLTDFIRGHRPKQQPIHSSFDDRPMDYTDSFLTQAGLLIAGRSSMQSFNSALLAERAQAVALQTGTISDIDLDALDKQLHPLKDSPFTQSRYTMKRMCPCGCLLDEVRLCGLCHQLAKRRVWIASIQNWNEVCNELAVHDTYRRTYKGMYDRI
jgi:hypothetical protein